MKLITLSGGLGNQLFQYALYLRLKQQEKHVYFTLQKIYKMHEHNGYELERVFHISQPRADRMLDRVLGLPGVGKLIKHLLFRKKYRERILFSLAANKMAISPKLQSVHLVGYWQSENYFLPCVRLLRKMLRFYEHQLSSRSQDMAEQIRSNRQSVSVHVRLGDYMQHPDFLGLCTETYYRKAIALMREKMPEAHFYLFSDNPSACGKIVDDHFTLVDWNKGEDCWQDMFLMSCCQGHITANSSFSWWGAWLDAKTDKIVITPSRWQNSNESLEVAAKGWIKMDSNGQVVEP